MQVVAFIAKAVFWLCAIPFIVLIWVAKTFFITSPKTANKIRQRERDELRRLNLRAARKRDQELD